MIILRPVKASFGIYYERSEILISDGARKCGLFSSLVCPIFHGWCMSRRTTQFSINATFYHFEAATHTYKRPMTAKQFYWVGLG